VKLHRQRRRIQVAFLVLFFVLLTLTVWPLGRVFLGAFLVADPLIALNSIVGGVVRWEMLFAALVLGLPLFLGRMFCGYVCPFGTLVELLGPRRERRLGDRWAWVRKAPLFVLVGCAGLLVFGSGLFLVFDPLTLLTRSATLLVYPAVDRVARLAGDLAYLAPPARGPVDAVTGLLSGRVIFARPLAFQLQALALLMVGAVLAASWAERRLWCRHLCPLGALLGVVSRWSLFGRRIDADACTRCGRCGQVCPLGAVREDGVATDVTRCQLGLECADVCPTGAITFGRRTRAGGVATYDPSRRALLAAGALALVGGFSVYGFQAGRRQDAYLVRPPGAVAETALLGLCSRCGQCMKVCPTNVLQPSLRSGWDGMFTPELSFVHGYCDYSCNECGKVCPTGAIQALTLEAKRNTVIGRAYIDRNRCIPWADFKDCIVCQELCPTPEKAIVLQVESVVDPKGTTVSLKRPWVLADLCIGCGICEANCPVSYEAAVRVQGVGA
jgi:polyferredoxin